MDDLKRDHLTKGETSWKLDRNTKVHFKSVPKVDGKTWGWGGRELWKQVAARRARAKTVEAHALLTKTSP